MLFVKMNRPDNFPLPFPNHPWYLNTILGKDTWTSTKVNDNYQNLQGILSFQQKRRYGLKIITPPALCPRLGPVLFYPNKLSTNAEKQSFAWKVLTKLAEQLPYFDYARILWPYQMQYGRPWQALGWSQSVRYSYVLNLQKTEEELWRDVRAHQQRNIRKAAKKLIIAESTDTASHWGLYRKTLLARPGVALPDRVVKGIDHLVKEDYPGRLFYASDNTGQVHASLFVIHDQKSAIYLLPYSDPQLRQSGAAPYLIWHAIRWAKEVGMKYFDFEGSHLSGVETFFRSFGAEAWPYYEFEKGRKWILAARLLT